VNKKAQGMSVTMIILIVLGLIIMGILIFMISGKVKLFGGTANSCTEKQGTCESKPEDCTGPIIGAMDCTKTKGADAVCCLKT